MKADIARPFGATLKQAKSFREIDDEPPAKSLVAIDSGTTNCQSQNTEGAFLESFPLKKGGMVSYGIELPARGFSVLMQYWSSSE